MSYGGPPTGAGGAGGIGGIARVREDPNAKWKILFAALFGIFMILLDTTVVNVALRTLQREFGANVNDIQWIVSLYVMATGIATPLSGYLGDRFGQKRVFLSAIALFAFGSILCGISPTLTTLIAARCLQGIGGGLALPLGTAQLYSAFPPEERGQAFGVFGIALVVAPALGPILGGALVDSGYWRAIFFLNVPIGALGLFLGSRWLRGGRPNRPVRFDPLGLAASTIGFGSLLFAASVASSRGWGAPSVIAGFVIGAIGLIAFAVIELFIAPEPLLNLRLFGNRVFALAAITGYVSTVALFGAEFVLPLYLQILRGRSALEAGVLLLPIALSSAVASPIAGRLYDRIGPRPLLVVGFSLLAVNTWQLAQLTANTDLRFVQVLLALRGLALGLTIQTTLTTGLSTVPGPQTARGSALINSTRQVIQSIAVAVLATVLATAVPTALNAQAQSFGDRAPQTQTGGTDSTGGRFELCAAGPPGLPSQAQPTVRAFCDDYIHGLGNTYRVTFYAALLAIVLGMAMPGWPAPWSGRQSLAGGAAPPRARPQEAVSTGD